MFDCKTDWDLVITTFMEHSTDKIWSQIVIEAESAIQSEPNLKNFLNENSEIAIEIEDKIKWNTVLVEEILMSPDQQAHEEEK